MKPKRVLCWSSVLWLSIGITHAQNTIDPARFEKLFKRMRERKEIWERMGSKQKQEIKSQKRQIEGSRSNVDPPSATVKPSPTLPSTERSAIETSKPWSPTSPIGFGDARN